MKVQGGPLDRIERPMVTRALPFVSGVSEHILGMFDRKRGE